MNKTFKICALIALTAGIWACDEGKYNDLSCDPAEIKSACVDGKFYWECEAATNKFGEMKACAVGTKCSDETGEAVCVVDETYPLVCHEGAKQCNGATIETCIQNQWIKAAQACPNGCADGACVDAVTPVCTEGAKQCNADGTGVQKCSGNAWVDDVACDAGCENGECKAGEVEDLACDSTTDTVKCDEDAITKMTCTDNVWVKESCVFGCDEGACKDAGECDAETDNAPICAPDTVTILTCVENVWTEGDKCENGCEEGKCKEGGDEPATCEYGTDQNKCDEDGITQLVCSETGVWVPTSCTFGCDADTAACKLADACDPETDTDPKCAVDNVTVIKCQEEVWTIDQTCPNGCEEGKCKDDGGDEPVELEACTEEDADKSKCSEDGLSHLTCTEGKWTPDDEVCLFGCEEGACKAADACTAGTDEDKCALDNATILTCSAETNVWTAGTHCENGCEEGACKNEGDEPVDACDATVDVPKCDESNANVMTCVEGQWVAQDPACEHGCTDGVCNSAD